MSNLFLILFLIFNLTLAFGVPLWRGKILTSSEVKKKWGNTAFNAEIFRTETYSTKSSMAYRILTDKSLIGLDVADIRKKFGPPDGFYFIDTYPAYIIQEGNNKSEETWQIVFLLNEKYKVREIIIHRNCCDK